MNNRLNIQDLAGLLSERSGKERGEMERFLRDLVAVISEGVYADKIVKVKGLGTFKIIPVEKRESIHVNTGERFLIPAHYKFSFLPDKDLREQVNKPFSIFETTEINEHVDFSDLVESVEEKGKDIEDESIEEVMPDGEAPLEPVEAEPAPVPSATKEVEAVQEMESVKEEAKVRKHRFIVSIAMGLAMLSLGLYLYNIYARHPLVVDDVKEQAQVLVKDTVRDTSTVARGDSLPMRDSVATPALTDHLRRLAPLGKVTIRHGDRLTLIAMKYYGNKLFWVYIYQHNKAIIDDPNNIPIGTEIEIPPPELYGIDSKSRISREKAAALQTEILTGK